MALLAEKPIFRQDGKPVEKKNIMAKKAKAKSAPKKKTAAKKKK